MNMIKRSTSLFSALILIFSLTVYTSAADRDTVYLGGMPFGIRFFTGKLTVSGFGEVDGESGYSYPAKDAGFLENDIIVMVDNTQVECAEDIAKAVRDSNGSNLKFTIERKSNTEVIIVTPVLSVSTGEYKIGLWLKDGTAGIGTVTYILPSGEFGGLGHGICDLRTGKLTDIKNGIVSAVNINGVVKGVSGSPGELRGIFSPEKCGKVISNKECGVFGYFLNPEQFINKDRMIKMSNKEDVQDGDATILSTVDESGIKAYSVKITKATTETDPKDSFIVEITDPTLIEKTGGIVQGMSGSPIIQNGKLVGAVTHVLISDPTRGYGIFIENMLEISINEEPLKNAG